ncbi:helix-loop-helix DNA-binding domain-containing protein [Loa loa]|uniref:Helix-loop-helix DNA-binding domain-containing protein n=1 Tax=Loa loa TaxID=7209 RepID=A0A1I7VK94_LOALO|nr:helix-loop-helix DNA-binding domain-containing protein [Loa loa]EFO14622.1 helix-loop-helix DNA-binding domain-containing protein [Loa loa]
MHIATTLQIEKGPRKVLKRAWERPPFMVAKRNARERTRVHAVNQAFVALKFHLPAIRSNTKRVSKLKILRAAIDYIAALTDLLHSENADFSKLNVSSYSFDNTMNVSSRSRQENQVSSKDNMMKIEESEQRQQRTIPQNTYSAAQCYGKQYWLAGHPVSN